MLDGTQPLNLQIYYTIKARKIKGLSRFFFASPMADNVLYLTYSQGLTSPGVAKSYIEDVLGRLGKEAALAAGRTVS